MSGKHCASHTETACAGTWRLVILSKPMTNQASFQVFHCGDLAKLIYCFFDPTEAINLVACSRQLYLIYRTLKSHYQLGLRSHEFTREHLTSKTNTQFCSLDFNDLHRRGFLAETKSLSDLRIHDKLFSQFRVRNWRLHFVNDPAQFILPFYTLNPEEIPYLPRGLWMNDIPLQTGDWCCYGGHAAYTLDGKSLHDLFKEWLPRINSKLKILVIENGTDFLNPETILDPKLSWPALEYILIYGRQSFWKFLPSFPPQRFPKLKRLLVRNELVHPRELEHLEIGKIKTVLVSKTSIFRPGETWEDALAWNRFNVIKSHRDYAPRLLKRKAKFGKRKSKQRRKVKVTA